MWHNMRTKNKITDEYIQIRYIGPNRSNFS